MSKRLFVLGCMLFLLVPFVSAQSIFDNTWGAEYFNNPYLAGTPSLVRQDQGIGFDWGFESPDEALPVDNFSVRWGKGGYLPAGTYQFIITADEGFRLYVDGDVILDKWDEPEAGATFGAEVFLRAGEHRIQIDYREFSRSAFIFLDWGLAPGGQAAPQPSNAGDNIATVTASILNVRSEARIANNVVARIGRGQQFPVLDISEDERWVQLNLGNNSSGWVSAAYVTIDGSATNSNQSGLEGLTLRSNARLLVRSAPTADADVIGMLRPNEVVPIRARNRDMTWWLVWDGARLGWVNGLYVTISSDVNPLDVLIAGDE